jgi:hypothetical protein
MRVCAQGTIEGALITKFLSFTHFTIQKPEKNSKVCTTRRKIKMKEFYRIPKWNLAKLPITRYSHDFLAVVLETHLHSFEKVYACVVKVVAKDCVV